MKHQNRFLKLVKIRKHITLYFDYGLVISILKDTFTTYVDIFVFTFRKKRQKNFQINKYVSVPKNIT